MIQYYNIRGAQIVRENELLNNGIRFPKVKVITDSGDQLILTKEEALQRAKEAGLDLLVVSPNAEPPVAKFLDYGHYRYEKEKKQKEAKKKNNQRGNILKELKLTPRIGVHDFNVRLNHGREFLGKGYKVKLTVFFKGREDTHPELGHELILKYLNQIEDLGWTDSPTLRPHLLGRMMSIIIVPGRKKNEDLSASRNSEQVEVMQTKE